MPKLVNLLNAQTAFSKLGSAPNAKIAYKARKIRRYLLPELEDYQETINDYMKEHAADGKGIDPDKEPEAFQIADDYFSGLVEEQIEVKWKPIPVPEVLETDLSMYDLDLLIDAGVLIDPEEAAEDSPEVEDEKEPIPAATEKGSK